MVDSPIAHFVSERDPILSIKTPMNSEPDAAESVC